MNILLRHALRLAAHYLPAALWARFLADRTVTKPSEVPLATDTPLRILALYHPGFRGDLEALADSGEAEVLLFPAEWQTRLVMAFYGPDYRNQDVMNPEPGSRFETAQTALTAFYERIADEYFARRPCDCAISFHIRIPADVDFARAIKARAIPYSTIYREGLIASSERVKRHMRLFFARLGNFQGDHFLVHNESAREFCIAEGYSSPDRTWTMGCIRMDGFLRDINAGEYSRETRSGTATLFPVSQHFESPEDSDAFYREFYGALFGFFAANPQYRLIIKPKPKQLKHAQKLATTALAGSGLDWHEIENVRFDAALDAHEALKISDVIIGLNSTVLLEAGVAGRPVVAPMFAAVDTGPAQEAVRFADAYAYFDVARDGAALAEILAERMADPFVDTAAMAGRRAMFEKYVSTLHGNALQRHIAFFRTLVDARRDALRDAA